VKGHYTTFITYARKYGTGIDVEKRWREWILEASIIENYGKTKRFTDKWDKGLHEMHKDTTILSRYEPGKHPN
jgi:hypothetical protein